MRFMPHYTVSYNGKFYRSGVEFEIDASDAEIMSMHGEIVGGLSEEAKAPQATVVEAEKPVRKSGRPRKQ